MNKIPSCIQAHVVLSTVWTMLANLCVIDAKHIKTAAQDSVHSRQKRNSFQFANMVTCLTNRNSFDFMDYGCYCGLGGMGQPKDDVDWCCYEHDMCWTEVLKNPECTGLSGPYTITYDWGCSSTSHAYCYDAENTCDRRTCDCDRKAAECFARSEYHDAYYDLDPWTNCNTTFVDNRFETTTPEAAESRNGNSAHASLPLTSLNIVFISIGTMIMTSFTLKTHSTV